MRKGKQLSRRQMVVGLAAASAIASPVAAQVVRELRPGGDLQPDANGMVTIDGFRQPVAQRVQRNMSSFRTHSWNGYFDSLRNGAILVDTKSRSLHYWPDGDRDYWIFPTSVPMSPELTRLGRTQIVRKVDGPEWRPTPNMLDRDPTLPEYVGPGPENPLGTHALYLSWQYYRIHGTNDTRKIGRMSSNGCIGLYNEDIAVLFGMAKVGTQVLLI